MRKACVMGSSVGALQTFFTSGFAAMSWAHASVIPFDGVYLSDCGDPYCWTKDTAPRFVGLEAVQDHGGGIVTFTLRIVSAPPPVTCPQYPPSTPPAIPTEYTPFYHFYGLISIPLPPLTQALTVDGSYNGSTKLGDSYLQLCSAGSPTATKAFFTNELPAHGWTFGTSPCGTANVWYQGKIFFSFPGTIVDSKLYHMQIANC